MVGHIYSNIFSSNISHSRPLEILLLANRGDSLGSYVLYHLASYYSQNFCDVQAELNSLTPISLHKSG